MSKIKGTKGERELLKELWQRGWATIRSAGSGSMRFPSPDLLAGKSERKLAIECKVTKEESKYFEKGEVEELLLFSKMFGAEPWFAVKFKKEDWIFINPCDLKVGVKTHHITKEEAKTKGLVVDEVVK
jgi:holliday junction resolvase Hjr